jgi:hypothetical protein
MTTDVVVDTGAAFARFAATILASLPGETENAIVRAVSAEPRTRNAVGWGEWAPSSRPFSARGRRIHKAVQCVEAA